MSKELPTSWFSTNGFDGNYKKIPKNSGVYILFNCNPDDRRRHGSHEREILYIGSSKNLYNRHYSHEVIRVLNLVYDFTKVFYRETKNYRKEEIRLIQLYKPRFNKQHND